MNRKISIGMAVSIVILAMTVTFSITMLVAMRLFDSTVSSRIDHLSGTIALQSGIEFQTDA